jgi:hypothetical protein
MVSELIDLHTMEPTLWEYGIVTGLAILWLWWKSS